MNRTFFATFATLLLIAAVCAEPAYAQGCALCHTQAAAATSRFLAALKEGIWLLIFPSLVVCTALTSMAYRRRERFRQSDSEQDGW